MTNTYAINTTRGKEFAVEAELQVLGLHPWVPRLRTSKRVQESPQPKWFDRPYVPKLLFCVIPAICWPDVVAIKDIHGKPFPFKQRDIDGRRAGFLTHPKPNEHIPLLGADGKPQPIKGVSGLKDFKRVVEDEYADMRRLEANNDYQCQYKAGQALELLGGAFEGLPAVFKDTIKHAHDEYAKLRADVMIFGRETTVEIDPDKARAFVG